MSFLEHLQRKKFTQTNNGNKENDGGKKRSFKGEREKKDGVGREK